MAYYKEKLTDEEKGWVLQLQETLRKHHRGDSTRKEKIFGGKITEFDIALHAIISKNEPHKAVKRLKRLKAFKQHYGIHTNTTVYEAIKIVSIFLSNYPNFIQSFNKDKFGRWVIFFNLKALTTTSTSTTSDNNANNANNNIDERFKALYYIFHALQPDLDSIRNGTIWIGDFHSITRQDIFGLINGGGRALCRDCYPIKVKDFPCINSPTVLSATYTICIRPFLSQRVKEVMAIGCTEEMLKNHFSSNVLPTKLGGSTQRPIDIMDIIETNLKRRFENEESFKLQILSSSPSKTTSSSS